MSDVTIVDDLSIVRMIAHNEKAFDWINENVDPDAPWFGGALCVEPRYAGPIIEGMINDGLEVTANA